MKLLLLLSSISLFAGAAFAAESRNVSYKSGERVALRVHCSPQGVAQMQPWLAEITLSVAEDALWGASASNGVEEQLQG